MPQRSEFPVQTNHSAGTKTRAQKKKKHTTTKAIRPPLVTTSVREKNLDPVSLLVHFL